MSKKTLLALTLGAVLPLSAFAATSTTATTTTTTTTTTKKVVRHHKKAHHHVAKKKATVVAAPVMNDKTMAPKVVLADNADFTGANIAAGIGYNMLNANTRFTNSTVEINRDNGNGGFATQLSAGYNFALNPNWILGPELHGQYNTTSINRDESFNGATTESAHITMKWIYGAAAKLGYATSANNLVYGMIGPDFTSLKQKYSGPTASNSFSSTQAGIFLALGDEQAITSAWHVREQVGYDYFSTQSKTVANGGKLKTYPQSLTFLVSGVYNF